MNYKEDQIGWLIIGFTDFFIFLTLVFYVLQIGNNPIPLSVAIALILLFIVIFALFYKLTVSIDNDYIRIIFGIGLIRKRVPLKDVSSVKKVKTKWYNGWGIRFVKNGILYNIHGFNAVELGFNNSTRRVLIGVKSNSKLENEIKKRINLN